MAEAAASTKSWKRGRARHAQAAGTSSGHLRPGAGMGAGVQGRRSDKEPESGRHFQKTLLPGRRGPAEGLQKFRSRREGPGGGTGRDSKGEDVKDARANSQGDGISPTSQMVLSLSLGKDSSKVTQGGRGRAGLEMQLHDGQWSPKPRPPSLVPRLSLAGCCSPRTPSTSTGTTSFREAAVPFVLPQTGARQEISHH